MIVIGYWLRIDNWIIWDGEETEVPDMQQGVVQQSFVRADPTYERTVSSQGPEDPAVSSPQQVRMRLGRNVNEFQKIFPVMNQDRKFYTPTFILQEE